ncbi:MAG: hypothetical protein IJX76_08075 [Clostridia bacterium]|nr:hypothetical protein [Clostridia bacterium]
MKKSNLKTILISGVSAALAATIAIGGTLAYLTWGMETKSNIFTVGDVDIVLKEDTKVIGEGGTVVSDENGATYTNIMPGDYLKKEVSVTNVGTNPAYVAVTVTLNNADKINAAIDAVYEEKGYTAEEVQAMYDYIFDGWGINYNPRPGAAGINDARGVIDGTYGLPENTMKVDFAKTTNVSTLIGATNWFIAGREKAGQYWVDGPAAFDGYYTADMEEYEICYTYYIYLESDESTTLFNGLNVPAQFDRDQMQMFDGLTIDIDACAIQADNIPSAAARESKEHAMTAFSILKAEHEDDHVDDGDVGELTVAVGSDDDLMAVLANAEAGMPLYIKLIGNVEWPTDGHHGENDVTPASSVVIDGNGYTLTATGSGVTPLGDTEAPMTLKNVKIVDNSVSYNEAAWELSYLEMGGKVLNCVNVEFVDPISVDSETATFTNCSFVGHNDKISNSTQYGVWVYNGDSTYTNCTFTGTRGMKICDRYANEVGTVEIDGCTFNGISEKPGVCIDDWDTQDMKITIKNSTFIGCKAGDQGLYIYETDNTVPVLENNAVYEVVKDDAALDTAIQAGDKTIYLGSGNYIIPDSAKGKILTIIGNGETVIATQDDGSYEGCDYSLDGATVTFENITINTDSSTYTGYARLKATYNNCTINGTYTLYGDSTFNNCTFNVSGDVYNIWTWGASNATFDGCTFNSDGKALLLYSTGNTNLTVNNCTFNDNGGLTDLKAAIEIGNDYNKSYTLTVNNTVVNGFEINDKGISTGTTLWANKNSMGTDKLNVVVDGVDVY